MTRPLSYLSDASLDALLSKALGIARRRGCGYDGFNWQGPALYRAVWELVEEYKSRFG